MENIMKALAPFDVSIPPPKRFWSALWKPGVQAGHPDQEFEIMRRSMVPGGTDVILNSEEQIRVVCESPWTAMKRASEAIADWFVRRDALEQEEHKAAAEGLKNAQDRKRDVERSRYFRYVSH
jgi:hypothetical protein